MRHGTLSANEVLGPDGKRGMLTVSILGNGTGRVEYKPYGVPKTYAASLESVARFVVRQEEADQ